MQKYGIFIISFLCILIFIDKRCAGESWILSGSRHDTSQNGESMVYISQPEN